MKENKLIYLVLLISTILFSFTTKNNEELKDKKIIEVSTDLVCSDCDFVINTNTGLVDGASLNIQPGDVIGLVMGKLLSLLHMGLE